MPSLELLDTLFIHIKQNTIEPKIQYSLIEKVLNEYGIKANVIHHNSGPVITMYKLLLSPGTKSNKLNCIHQDLSRELSNNIRIKNIPNTVYLGLELANKNKKTVQLKTIFSSKIFKTNEYDISLALGLNSIGKPVIVDLVKMPHLLIAGTTGSGKTNGIHAIILSLLYKYSYNFLKLIIIDPKMVEFKIYNNIPNLVNDVVTTVDDSIKILHWCVDEMNSRYQFMSKIGVKNIKMLNEKLKKNCSKNKNFASKKFLKFPYLIIIIDEFADLIMSNKTVENLIVKLAQKSRAAGMHLILSTQRPSVDFVTGKIKANIPARIAFKVASKIDSRTIIDQNGAEQLLGNGDMLYISADFSEPYRIHGSYVSDIEINKIIKFLKKNN